MRNKKAYLWGIIGRIGPQAINLLIYTLLARYLTPADFGTIGVLSVFIAVSMTLSEAGFGGSLIKEETITKEDCKTVFGFNLAVSSLLYIIMFLGAKQIEDFYNIKNLVPVIRTLSTIYIFGALCTVPKSLMIRDLKFKELTTISLISYIIAGIIAFIGCSLKWGVYAIVAFQVTNAATNTLLTLYYSHYTISLGFCRKSFKHLFSFGAFTTICNIIDSIYDNIMSILFGKFTGITMVGYYDQTKKIETGTSNAIVTTINTVSFPILTRIRNDIKTFSEEANSLFFNLTYIIFPLLSLIAIYSTDIILLLWGDKWAKASPFLSLLMINGMVSICESLIRNNIKSLGHVKSLANITICKRIIGLTIIILFMYISDFAMLYGLLLSTILGFIVNLWLYCRIVETNMTTQLIQCLKYIALPLGISFICFEVSLLLPRNFLLSISTNLIILTFYYSFGYIIINRKKRIF